MKNYEEHRAGMKLLSPHPLPLPSLPGSAVRHQLQGFFPDASSSEFFLWVLLLEDKWRGVAPFYQKTLLLPAPAKERIVSTNPLYTWEYDEVPWMEVSARHGPAEEASVEQQNVLACKDFTAVCRSLSWCRTSTLMSYI